MLLSSDWRLRFFCLLLSFHNAFFRWLVGHSSFSHNSRISCWLHERHNLLGNEERDNRQFLGKLYMSADGTSTCIQRFVCFWCHSIPNATLWFYFSSNRWNCRLHQTPQIERISAISVPRSHPERHTWARDTTTEKQIGRLIIRRTLFPVEEPYRMTKDTVRRGNHLSLSHTSFKMKKRQNRDKIFSKSHFALYLPDL